MAIEGVIFELQPTCHVDARRKMIAVLNGDFSDFVAKQFVAKQVKLLDVFQDTVLGGHYHDYAELYYLINGSIRFDLEQIDTKERDNFVMLPGSRLYVPARIAHKATAKKGTLFLGMSGSVYTSSEINDKKYEI